MASGEVEVATQDESGDRFILAKLGPGDVVGEVGMILRRKAAADVVAIHPTVTLHLAAADFHAMVRAHPQLFAELYDLAVKRDEETSSVVAQEATSADDDVLI
jgi:cAMP-dependent protein kinase regulator